MIMVLGERTGESTTTCLQCKQKAFIMKEMEEGWGGGGGEGTVLLLINTGAAGERFSKPVRNAD